MGVRRLFALVDGLPLDSAVARDGKAWTRQDEIAATAVERSQEWFGVLTQLWGAKPRDLPLQITFQHPDRKTAAEAPQNVSSDPAVIRAFLSA